MLPANEPPVAVQLTGAVAVLLILHDNVVDPPELTLVGEPEKTSVGATFAVVAGVDEGGVVVGVVALGVPEVEGEVVGLDEGVVVDCCAATASAAICWGVLS